eukprot:CAMPEP_0174362752 /NCGR_PEP_ID=MMETSP0811_2-20130205/65912_1 /TAXON_ID=73025 ORGANISM="Eutreptiella gymnastica-like, Strain CCMP1594" /NCGR_SAMPLE_ID=MMETSP0811_2 /ASSEMBLY_ACC=CAM_ASM_000667 /LENGTH=76 /DNA_ID=CAMNT_0015500781 /DNA_START=1360 /DNA_END=1586 /DNA_ORIENTATION=+
MRIAAPQPASGVRGTGFMAAPLKGGGGGGGDYANLSMGQVAVRIWVEIQKGTPKEMLLVAYGNTEGWAIRIAGGLC